MPAVAEKIGAAGESMDSLAQTHSILKSMVEAKQQELRDLQALMTKEQGYLSQLRGDAAKQRQELEQELRLRRQEFEQEIAGERQRLRDLQHNLDQVGQDIQTQKRELEILVANAEVIRKERDQAVQERITMEQQRVRAAELQQQAEHSLHLLHQTQSEVASATQTVEERTQKLDLKESDLLVREETLGQREQALSLDLDQLRILREEVDPKLEELAVKTAQVTEREAVLATSSTELANQRTEIAQGRADLEGLAQRLEAKTQQLNERELRLRQFQSELHVKIQRAKAKGIEVPSLESAGTGEGNPSEMTASPSAPPASPGEGTSTSP